MFFLRLRQFSTLVCDFGGMFGLYLGCSFLTFFEFLDLGFELLIVACGSFFGRSQRTAKEGSMEGDLHGGSVTHRTTLEAKAGDMEKPKKFRFAEGLDVSEERDIAEVEF